MNFLILSRYVDQVYCNYLRFNYRCMTAFRARRTNVIFPRRSSEFPALISSEKFGYSSRFQALEVILFFRWYLIFVLRTRETTLQSYSRLEIHSRAQRVIKLRDIWYVAGEWVTWVCLVMEDQVGWGCGENYSAHWPRMLNQRLLSFRFLNNEKN